MIHSCPPSSNDARAALDALAADDDTHLAIRELLICDDELTLRQLAADCPSIPLTDLHALRSLIDTIDDDPYARDTMTDLLLSFSLCPLHRIDYAICFDDDDPECAQIRTIHPSHDT